MDAGNLYVNRGTTGAIVGRQPFGGWKRSSVGAGTKAGGPNYLIGLGGWKRSTDAAPASARLDPSVARVVRAASAFERRRARIRDRGSGERPGRVAARVRRDP